MFSHLLSASYRAAVARPPGTPSSWLRSPLPPEPCADPGWCGLGQDAVLTTRIAWLLQTGQPPGGILAVTFTNKAAKEMVARPHGYAAGERARHVDRHLPRPVQPLSARAPQGCSEPAAGVPDPGHGKTAVGHRCASSSTWTKNAFRPSNCLVHRRLQRKTASARRRARRDADPARRSRSTSSTKTNASAKAWSDFAS